MGWDKVLYVVCNKLSLQYINTLERKAFRIILPLAAYLLLNKLHYVCHALAQYLKIFGCF